MRKTVVMDLWKKIGIGLGCMLLAGVGRADSVRVEAHSSTPYFLARPTDVQYQSAKMLPQWVRVAALHGDLASEPSAIQVKLPANDKIPWHHHPLDEVVVGVQGQFEVTTRRTGQVITVGSGQFMVMPAKMVHQARCVSREDCVVRLFPPGPWDIVYENPADDPRGDAGKK
jgi:quercetin dioxygenase-like cupin family protein